jgi:hypothetical protein
MHVTRPYGKATGPMNSVLKILIFLVLYLSADALVEAGRDLYGHDHAPVAAAESTDDYVPHLCGMGVCLPDYPGKR